MKWANSKKNPSEDTLILGKIILSWERKKWMSQSIVVRYIKLSSTDSCVKKTFIVLFSVYSPNEISKYPLDMCRFYFVILISDIIFIQLNKLDIQFCSLSFGYLLECPDFSHDQHFWALYESMVITPNCENKKHKKLIFVMGEHISCEIYYFTMFKGCLLLWWKNKNHRNYSFYFH